MGWPAELRSLPQIATARAEVKPSDLALLLTRPRDGSERFAAELEARTGPFAARIISPLLEIVPRALPDLPADAVLAFTSENAVRAVAAGRTPAGRPAYCVGARTAAAARAAGFEARSAEGDAADLAGLILRDRPAGELVHLAGAHQRGDLAKRLAAAGLPARRVAVYDQRPLHLAPEARAALAGARPLLVPVFSPRSAALLSVEAADAVAPLLLAFLSSAVEDAWTGPARTAAVAERPDSDRLAAAAARLVAETPGA